MTYSWNISWQTCFSFWRNWFIKKGGCFFVAVFKICFFISGRYSCFCVCQWMWSLHRISTHFWTWIVNRHLKTNLLDYGMITALWCTHRFFIPHLVKNESAYFRWKRTLYSNALQNMHAFQPWEKNRSFSMRKITACSYYIWSPSH